MIVTRLTSITFYIKKNFLQMTKERSKCLKTVLQCSFYTLVLFVQLCVCVEHSSDHPRNTRNFRLVWFKLNDFLWALIRLGLQKTLTGSNILIYIGSKFVILNPDGLNLLHKFQNKHICIWTK